MFKKKESGVQTGKWSYKQKALALIIGLIGVFLLVFLIVFLVSRVFRAEDISNFLPKDSVVAVARISINPSYDQVESFYRALNKHEIYSKENIVRLVNDFLDTDFVNNIQPWAGRQFGIAFLEKNNSPGEIENLFFVEVSDKNKTLDFMKSRGIQTQEEYLLSEDYLGIPVYRYSLSQTYNFIFLNNHLVIAANEDLLKLAIDVYKGKTPKLKNNPLYQKISHNLPINNLIFLYTDVDKLINTMKLNPGFMTERGRDLLAFEPFLKIYKGFGVTVLMQNDNIALQTYTMLDNEYLNGKELLTYQKKYRANMMKLMPKNLVFYAGGVNLYKQIQRFSELFSAGGEVSYLIFEGLLNAQKNNYFGREVSLDEDIYPLLQGEYAFAMADTGGEQAFIAMLELAEPLKEKAKIGFLAESFVNRSAILNPRVIETVLEDGTTTKEIQTTPEEIIKSAENYKGFEIDMLKTSNKTWGVYYIIMDKTFIISSDKEIIYSIIDSAGALNGGFTSTNEYIRAVQPVLNISDEIVYMDFAFLRDTLKEVIPVDMMPFFEPFKSVSAGNNYFKDGISSVNYLIID